MPNETIFLYGQGGAGNHGCEAIVRSTAQLLAPARLTVFSHNPEQDVQFGLDAICDIRPMTNKFDPARRSLKSMRYNLYKNILKNEQAAFDYYNGPVVSAARPGRRFLSVGGDVYCYDSWRAAAKLNDRLLARGAKLVLWGASVEPAALAADAALRAELARFSLITARETLSYTALREVNPNTVLVCDTAFALTPSAVALPKGFVPGKTVGVNVSPLVQGAGKNALVTENYAALIEWTLAHTEHTVALIPHVTWVDVNDLAPLTALYERYRATGRVVLVGAEYNCCQLKYLIAQCCAFVGARTHATIAAYSSGVPTLVCGYSVKARGIAQDLFGAGENYVVPVQSLTAPAQLADAFAALYAEKEAVAERLKAKIPAYLGRLDAAKAALAKV
ncbi:MAG: polysaccharide pyruvyl transferase family protein [Faecalibacterium sp.]|jgi:polysaccharide pyruvyl transferase WcaK-like protein|nr:polysaccharide pyruvyl transferase family protein [Faecalibacterium sp.]